jgi:hypothetical protein
MMGVSPTPPAARRSLMAHPTTPRPRAQIHRLGQSTAPQPELGVEEILPKATVERVLNVDGVQGAVVPPLVEIPPHGALGREVLGKISPLAAGAEDGEDGIDDIPQVGRAGSSAGGAREVRLDPGPLLVGDVAGVVVRSHTPSTSLDPLLPWQESRSGFRA